MGETPEELVIEKPSEPNIIPLEAALKAAAEPAPVEPLQK